MSALAYLQSRLLLHGAFAVLRSPARLTLWILNIVIVVVVALAWSKAPIETRAAISFPTADVLVVAALFTGLAAELLCGIGYPTPPSLREDDFFLVGLGVDQRVELLRRRLSSTASAATSYGFRLLPIGIFFLPHGPLALSWLSFFALTIVVGVVLLIAPLAIFMWRGSYAAQIRGAGIAASIIGILTAAAPFVPSLRGVYQRCSESCGAYPPWPALLIFTCLAGTLIACILTLRGPVSALDAPVRLTDERTGKAAYTAVRDELEQKVLPGRLQGAWSEWWRLQTIEQRQGASRYVLIAFGVSCASGALLGIAARAANPQIVWLCGFLFANAIIAFNASRAIRISSDLALSLWWVGADPPFARLSARIAYDMFGQAIVVASFVTCYFAIVAPRAVLVAILLALGLILLSSAVSGLAYAMFPAGVDTRGPAWLLRIGTTYAVISFSALVATVIEARFPSNFAEYVAALALIAEAAALYGTFLFVVLRRPERLGA